MGEIGGVPYYRGPPVSLLNELVTFMKLYFLDDHALFRKQNGPTGTYKSFEF